MVHIPDPQAGIIEVGGQILRHLFGQGGHEHPLLPGSSRPDFVHQVVDLPFDRLDHHLRIEQAGRTDDLFHRLGAVPPLKIPRRGADEHHLVDPVIKLVEIQRPVVVGARQAEPIIDQIFLAGEIPAEHAANLGQGHVGFVHEEQIVVRKIIEQSKGRRTGGPSRQDTGIVLDPLAHPDFPQHLDVIAGTLKDALRLEKLSVLFEKLHPFGELPLDLLNRVFHFVPRNDIVRGRVDGDMAEQPFKLARQRIDLADAVDLVPKKLHPDDRFPCVGGENFDHVAADAELVPGEIDVVAFILELYQLGKKLVPRFYHARPQGNNHVAVVDGVAEAVNAGNARHDDDVSPL